MRLSILKLKRPSFRSCTNYSQVTYPDPKVDPTADEPNVKPLDGAPEGGFPNENPPEAEVPVEDSLPTVGSFLFCPNVKG